MLSPALDSFLREVGEAVARPPDAKLVVDSVGEAVRRLLSGSFFLDEALTRPDPGRIARHELFRDSRFSLVVCVIGPGQSTPIHDHPGWGVVAAVSNRAFSSTWRRLDDGQLAGFASLAEVTRTLVTETSYAYLRPPDEVIHHLENPFRDPAVTLHVLGLGGTQANLYDPRQKTVAPDALASLVGV